MDLVGIFLTGLITGGLTCMAVQGGLLASTIAQRHQEHLQSELATKGHALSILSFLIAKLIAYTLFGFFLGWVGSLFTFSLTAKVAMQAAAGIFMIGTALNLLNVHPIFRYFIIQPPRFLFRLVRKESKSKDIFAPALLGAFTIFIPCGTTQAMMALAIASASPWLGAAALFVFVLGTSPLFFTLGYFASKIGESFRERFTKIAALAVLTLGILSINGAVWLSGSPVTLESIWEETYCTFSICSRSVLAGSVSAPVTEATITIEGNGYSPKNFSVKAGQNVTLHLVNTTGNGCSQAFTIPSLGISKVVPLGKEDTVTFIAPEKPQEIAFMCGMGMYRGKIKVI